MKADSPVHQNQLILRICVCLIMGLLLLLTRGAGADVSYVYDAAGRPKLIFDGTGQIFTYTYDSDGNITNVATAAPTFIVSSFYPSHGSIGTSVTIYGAGFNTTPNQNTVTFNGNAATVVSSTAQTIVTSVPSGATTGTIYVSSSGHGAGSAPTSFQIP